MQVGARLLAAGWSVLTGWSCVMRFQELAPIKRLMDGAPPHSAPCPLRARCRGPHHQQPGARRGAAAAAPCPNSGPPPAGPAAAAAAAAIAAAGAHQVYVFVFFAFAILHATTHVYVYVYHCLNER